MTDEAAERGEELPPPRHLHECSLCAFLGTVEHDGREYDLYHCERGHMQPTIIARASSMPHDYVSGIFMAAYDPVLAEAAKRAQDRGLLPKDLDELLLKMQAEGDET